MLRSSDRTIKSIKIKKNNNQSDFIVNHLQSNNTMLLLSHFGFVMQFK